MTDQNEESPLGFLLPHVKRKNFEEHIGRACKDYLNENSDRLSEEKLNHIVDALNKALGHERFSQLQQLIAKNGQGSARGWQSR